VADHKAQGDRLDFGRLFMAYRDQFAFLVGGSDEDRFEHLQVDLARQRLGKLGLKIERLPGGHLTTNEQPEALAALIARFATVDRRTAPIPAAWPVAAEETLTMTAVGLTSAWQRRPRLRGAAVAAAPCRQRCVDLARGGISP